MSLINQMLSDLQERRGGLPPTEPTALSGLIATGPPSPPPQEPSSRRRSSLLVLLLVVSALLIKREAVTAWISVLALSQDGVVVATGMPIRPAPVTIQKAQETPLAAVPPEQTSATTVVASHTDNSLESARSAAAQESTNVPPGSAPESTMAVVTPAVADTEASAQTTGAELSQLAIKKEADGIALGLHLSSPVQYTLETDSKGEATLRLTNVRLREGYLQTFDHDGPIRDIQVRHGDSGEVAVQFSLRAGVSASRTEITAAEDGGYLLMVHCTDSVAAAYNPDVSGSTVSPPQLADAANSKKTKNHTIRPEDSTQTASGGKRELRAQKAPSRVDRSDAPAAEPVVVENEQPGGFRKITHAADPVDRKTKLYESAMSALHAGDRTQALALATQALDADDTAIAPRLLVATILMEDKRWAEARTQLETGLGQTPENRDYKLLYARLLSETDETGKAIEILTHDAPTPADDPDYHALLAALMQRTGRHGDAIVSYQRLLSVQPQNGLWWMGLGISLSAAGQRQQAHEAFNHALTDRNLPDRVRQYLNDQLQQLREASS